jgi:ABC-type phosphate/phosphonate transport system substrate-binding protein
MLQIIYSEYIITFHKHFSITIIAFILCFRETFKEFVDLKGHKWAFNNPSSMSGSISTLAELKKLGYNASFFGNVIQTGKLL